MPLRVHCPSGCLIRMPGNRAGKNVRCPGCKTVLQIPAVLQTELDTGKPITLIARFAALKPPGPTPDARRDADSPANQSSGGPQVEPDTKQRLEVPEFAVHRNRKSVSAVRSGSEKQVPADESIRDLDTSETRTPSLNQEPRQPSLMADRVQRAHADRIILSRFFAFCLCGVAVVNMIPSVYHWYQWSQSATGQQLPRWTYLLIFVASIHAVYALYVFQLPDWSALKTVAGVMIVLAALFGLVSTGLVVGGGQGNVARFLNLPFVMVRAACIWCVAMLCLATLTSYLIGREAMNWQRVEQLMRQIESGV